MTVIVDRDVTIQTAREVLEKHEKKAKGGDSSSDGGGGDDDGAKNDVATTSSSIKLKSLTKKVAKKLSKGNADDEAKKCKVVLAKIQQTITECPEEFVLCSEKKFVSLAVAPPNEKKKRKKGDDDEDREKPKKKKKDKKSKKDKGKAESPNDGSNGDDVPTWRKKNRIVLVDGTSSTDVNGAQNKPEFHPWTTFDQCLKNTCVSSELIGHCTGHHKYERPSPIQAQCWPILLSPRSKDGSGLGRDVIGIAETGSGKTLAFGLPILSSLSRGGKAGKNRKEPPKVLVLAPTRELAQQSHVVLADFGSIVGLSSLVVYGGVPKHPQTRALSARNIDCVVATPGRLVDLINDGTCSLSNIRHLVLDEADRMLDMGFEKDVKFIISECPPRERRQTIMCSATWPAIIQELAGEYMVDPLRVYVGFESIDSGGQATVDDSLSANRRVSQTVEVIDDRAREARLMQLLRKYHGHRDDNSKDLILVFALYKREASRLEETLKRRGFPSCSSIHGDKAQDARTRALSDFKAGHVPILIATDVAARGLDIPSVRVVINYTFPLTIEDYVHRIGRTGRAGQTGISHTFFQPTDKNQAGALQQVMRQAGQSIPEELMAFGSTIKKKEHKLYGSFGPRDNGVPMKESKKITFSYSDDEN